MAQEGTPKDYQPRTIGIWLDSLASSAQQRTPVEAEALAAKDDAILALLAKLSQHYWRPDFTEGQARQLYADYLFDLHDYSLRDISDAITKYRQSPEKFFPTSGQLVQIIRTIPAWDIRTPVEHGNILRTAARKELQQIVERLGSGQKALEGAR